MVKISDQISTINNLIKIKSQAIKLGNTSLFELYQLQSELDQKKIEYLVSEYQMIFEQRVLLYHTSDKF